MAGDRLSELSDDLLRRVLHFAPYREAASTGALSRRFRSLWRASAAVNLEARIPSGTSCQEDARFVAVHSGFLSAARAALEAADAVPVTRLTFRVEACSDDVVSEFLDQQETDVVAAVLSHPAARRVHELRLAAVESNGFTSDYKPYPPSYRMTPCDLSLGSLPWETLRVLDLTGCSLGDVETPAPAFPRLPLASLRLCKCVGSREFLQALSDAAPGLGAVRLESAILYSQEEIKRFDDPTRPRKEEIVARLRFPSATELVLELCCWTMTAKSLAGIAVEIDAPRLRCFKYKGALRRLSLASPSSLARADLRFVDSCDISHITKDPHPMPRAILWKLLCEFRHAKELKLAVRRFEDIAVVSASERAELLCNNGFPGLVSLELAGVHNPKGKTAAVAIANLLRCCPVLRDLRINLNTAKGESSKRPQHVREFLRRKSRDDLNETMDHFMRSRLGRAGSLQGGGDDDKNDDEVSGIPALCRRSFHCLRRSLRCVGLQFRPKKSNCFGMKLIKFFAENAVALEELRIDAGNRRMHEHMNCKVERWIAKSSRKSSTSLVVLPLKR